MVSRASRGISAGAVGLTSPPSSRPDPDERYPGCDDVGKSVSLMVSTFRHHTDINTCKIFYTDVYPRETYSGKGFVLVVANQVPKHMCGYGILGLAFTTVEGVSTPCV